VSAAEQLALPYRVVGDSADRDDWLKARRCGIGASEISAVLGENPWSSPFTLWARKVGRAPEQDETEPMFLGKELEATILRLYSHERYAHRPVKPAGLLLQSVEHPWALCTLDGETVHPKHATIPLEAKLVAAFSADEWTEGPPDHYHAQIQQQMLVTGAACASVAALIGNRFVWCDVERDQTTINRIIYHGSRFWQSVVNEEPPKVDGSESTRSTLGAMYPTASDRVKVIPEFANLDAERQAEKAAEKRAKERIAEIDNQIKAAIGDAGEGVIPGVAAYVWREQTRRSYTVAESKFRQLTRKGLEES
jgi:putative phage-type endonuclease